jgi:dihydroxyacetone kinase-like protein
LRHALLHGAVIMETPVDIFARMTAGAIGLLRDNQARLSELDSAIGDGDHGTTIARAVARMEDAIQSHPRDLAELLNRIGNALLGLDGGATGPLFATFYLGMAEAAPQPGATIAEWAAMFEAGRDALLKRTKARAGDKTLMDALLPAVEALRAAANRKEELGAAMTAAAAAARSGAASTAEYRARFGRARFLGDRAVGHQDPGATSLALLFEGFTLWLIPTTSEKTNNSIPACP